MGRRLIGEKYVDLPNKLQLVSVFSVYAAANTCMQLDLVDASGKTAMHVATQDGKINALMEMLGRSVNVDARDAAAETPLHSAARSGKVSAVGGIG